MKTQKQNRANPKDFTHPHDVSGITATMGAGDKVFDLMPAYKEIPEEFRSRSTPFNDLQHQWFFNGINGPWPLKTKPEIDKGKALAHLAAIQRSFSPPHEHKAAGVAYLMSLWFEAPAERKENK